MNIKDLPEKVLIVEKRKDGWGTDVRARFICGCTDSGCDVHIDCEYNTEDDELVLMFYKKLKWHESYMTEKNTFFERLSDRLSGYKERFIVACRVLFTGYIDVESDILIHGEKDINSFIELLSQCKDWCKEEDENAQVKKIIEGLEEKTRKLKNDCLQNMNES